MDADESSFWRDRPHGLEWFDAVEFLIPVSIALAGICVITYLVLANVVAQRHWLEAMALVGSILLVAVFLIRDFMRKRVGLVTGLFLIVWLGLTVSTAFGYF